MRLVGWAGDEGGFPSFRFSLGGEVGGSAALSLARVGACADELRLMGVEGYDVPTGLSRAGVGKDPLSRKSSRACDPPGVERMWRGPWADDANNTTKLVESGGRLRDHLYLFASGALSGDEGK